jgi:hypothetical protein
MKITGLYVEPEQLKSLVEYVHSEENTTGFRNPQHRVSASGGACQIFYLNRIEEVKKHDSSLTGGYRVDISTVPLVQLDSGQSSHNPDPESFKDLAGLIVDILAKNSGC